MMRRNSSDSLAEFVRFISKHSALPQESSRRAQQLQKPLTITRDNIGETLASIGVDDTLADVIQNDWFEFHAKGYSPSYISRLLGDFSSQYRSFSLPVDNPLTEPEDSRSPLEKSVSFAPSVGAESLLDTITELQRLVELRTNERDYFESQHDALAVLLEEESEKLKAAQGECEYWQSTVKDLEGDLHEEIEMNRDLKARLHDITFTVDQSKKEMVDEECQLEMEDLVENFSMTAVSMHVHGVAQTEAETQTYEGWGLGTEEPSLDGGIPFHTVAEFVRGGGDALQQESGSLTFSDLDHVLRHEPATQSKHTDTNDLVDDVQQLRDRFRQLEDTHAQYVKNTANQRTEAEEEIERVKSIADDMQQMHSAQKQKLQQQVSQLQESLETKDAQRFELTQKVEMLEKAERKHQARVDELLQQLQAAHQVNDDLIIRVHDLEIHSLPHTDDEHATATTSPTTLQAHAESEWEDIEEGEDEASPLPQPKKKANNKNVQPSTKVVKVKAQQAKSTSAAAATEHSHEERGKSPETVHADHSALPVEKEQLYLANMNQLSSSLLELTSAFRQQQQQLFSLMHDDRGLLSPGKSATSSAPQSPVHDASAPPLQSVTPASVSTEVTTRPRTPPTTTSAAQRMEPIRMASLEVEAEEEKAAPANDDDDEDDDNNDDEDNNNERDDEPQGMVDRRPRSAASAGYNNVTTHRLSVRMEQLCRPKSAHGPPASNHPRRTHLGHRQLRPASHNSNNSSSSAHSENQEQEHRHQQHHRPQQQQHHNHHNQHPSGPHVNLDDYFPPSHHPQYQQQQQHHPQQQQQQPFVHHRPREPATNAAADPSQAYLDRLAFNDIVSMLAPHSRSNPQQQHQHPAVLDEWQMQNNEDAIRARLLDQRLQREAELIYTYDPTAGTRHLEDYERSNRPAHHPRTPKSAPLNKNKKKKPKRLILGDYFDQLQERHGAELEDLFRQRMAEHRKPLQDDLNNKQQRPLSGKNKFILTRVPAIDHHEGPADVMPAGPRQAPQVQIGAWANGFDYRTNNNNSSNNMGAGYYQMQPEYDPYLEYGAGAQYPAHLYARGDMMTALPSIHPQHPQQQQQSKHAMNQARPEEHR